MKAKATFTIINYYPSLKLKGELILFIVGKSIYMTDQDCGVIGDPPSSNSNFSSQVRCFPVIRNIDINKLLAKPT